MWELQWGDKLEFLEELEESGKSPHALETRPSLAAGIHYYIESFMTLSARRPVNNVEGAIPISELLAYLQLYPWYDNDLFIKYMIILDDAYLHHKKEAQSDNKTVDFRSKN